jgi:hypothetical protein
MRRRFLILLTSLLAMMLAAFAPVQAQDYSEQDVIDMVIAQVPFSYGLQTVPDWTAAAYDSGNAYGIWRVQFWNAAGEEIGWANINPTKQRIYDYDAPFESTEEQRVAADPIVREYIYNHPDIIELLGDPEAFADDMWVGYNGWVEAWGVWLNRGDDSLYFIVQFEGKEPDALSSPTLIEIGFPNVMSYDEWQTNMGTEATTVAFAEPDIASVLRDVTGWQSHAERQPDGLWQVTFTQDDTELVKALVNLESRELIEWSAP